MDLDPYCSWLSSKQLLWIYCRYKNSVAELPTRLPEAAAPECIHAHKQLEKKKGLRTFGHFRSYQSFEVHFLSFSRGRPGRGIAVRQFSPLHRREGPPPQPPTRRVPPKSPAFYGVLCSSHFFPFFGACGSRWVNMGLETLKTSAAAFEGLRTSQPSAAAFGHGTSLGPTSCFY